MSNSAVPRLVLISFISPLGDVSAALQKVRETDGHILELEILPIHLIQDGEIAPEYVLRSIYSAKAVKCKCSSLFCRWDQNH